MDPGSARPDDAGDGNSWGFEEGDEIAPGRTALSHLGGGHRYEAYLAWDDRLLTTVVVKVLRPRDVDDERSRRGLVAEKVVLDRVDHPVIVRAFGLDADGPRPHLALEHLEGPRLSTLLRKYGPLPPEQLLPLALQVAAALHYLDGEKIVHLDVKPSNIIMGAPPRLIDFSIARTFEDAVRLTTNVGTDAYMAPEQCDLGRAPIGAPADVWGLGATLYEALTGRLAFDGEGRFPQLSGSIAPFERDVPRAFAEPILACLAMSPEDRPTAGEFHQMLEPLLSALPRRIVLGRLKPKLR